MCGCDDDEDDFAMVKFVSAEPKLISWQVSMAVECLVLHLAPKTRYVQGSTTAEYVMSDMETPWSVNYFNVILLF